MLLKLSLSIVALALSTVQFASSYVSISPTSRRSALFTFQHDRRIGIASLSATSNPTLERPDFGTIENPVLFDAIRDTLCLSALVYPFARLRQVVGSNPSEWIDPENILDLTTDILYLPEVKDFVLKNKEKVMEDPEFQSFFKFGPQLFDGDDVRIRCFDDKNSQKELVYGIVVNRSLERITVVFRGSSTTQDWLQNVQWGKYPVVDDCSDTPGTTYDVHEGIRDYLREDSVKPTDPDDKPISKFQVITDQLIALTEEVKNETGEVFDVYVTGHSLGGALANFYAMKLSEQRLRTLSPLVTCITFASPYVGSPNYQDAVRRRERCGELRHFRVSNANDCITSNPFVTDFGHAGANVKLISPKTPPELITYGANRDDLPTAFYVMLAAFGSIAIKVLSVLPPLSLLSFLPTLPILPSILLFIGCAKVLLGNHDLASYLERFEPHKDYDFLAKKMKEVYADRLTDLEADA